MKTLYIGSTIDGKGIDSSRLVSCQEHGSVSLSRDLLRVAQWEINRGRLEAADECIRVSLALEREERS